MNTNVNCPSCGIELWLMSTDNEWIYKCERCRERYNRALEKMPDLAASLTSRIIAYVSEHPGCTAWSIARNMGENSATVSSILSQKTNLGVLRREKRILDAWLYFPVVR